MKQFYLSAIFSLITVFVFAQVGIGTVNPSPVSMLDVSSTSDGGTTYKGFMPPRVPNAAARDAINPGYSDFGLLVFVEHSGSLQIWDGDSWENIWNGTVATPEIWINEIHYDNDGTDANEAIEVAGASGVDLSDYQIVLYNGSNGNTYGSSISLSGVLMDQANGYGFQSFAYSGIQNGNPDGIALVKISTGNVIQFLSYGGTFTANNGPAAGRASVDIGVSQSGGAPVGTSLQLIGTGNEYIDFTWGEDINETFGSVNNGQTID